MQSVRYYVCSCLDCNSIVMFKIEYLEFSDECCMDYKNLKVLKIFNDELEARNFYESISKKE